MFLYYFSIGLTVISSALYHVVQKLTPGNVNPLLSLAVTYAAATLICLLLLPVFHQPYAPRGNAMVSVLGLTVISCLYFGAMSRRGTSLP